MNNQSPITAAPQMKPAEALHQGSSNLKGFLDASGIRFLDNLANFGRRDTLLPPVAPTEQSLFNDMTTYSVSVPALEVHEFGCAELKQYIDDGKISIMALEEAFDRSLPKLYLNFQNGSSNTKDFIKSQLKNLKVVSRLYAKEQWYSWRKKLLTPILTTMDEHYQHLEQVFYLKACVEFYIYMIGSKFCCSSD
jgi:kinetochore protein Spc7/SPC105